jgi:hypothetical protein
LRQFPAIRLNDVKYLLDPHHNIGVINIALIDLSSSGEFSNSIAFAERWIHDFSLVRTLVTQFGVAIVVFSDNKSDSFMSGLRRKPQMPNLSFFANFLSARISVKGGRCRRYFSFRD